MNKRISSRAVIIDNNELLTLFRRKNKDGKIREYYVIPGGGLEQGETFEDNVKRELKEELNVDIEILGFLGKEECDDSIAYYFHARIVKGIPKLGGEELERMTEDNYYEVRYIKLEDLKDIDINAKDKVRLALTKKYSKLD